MAFKKGKSYPTAIFVLCFSLFCLFLLCSKASSAELFKGLKLCTDTLIPTLFPYMVISEMLVRSGTISFVSPTLGRVSERLFGISGASGAAILLGWLCGFPVGAKITAGLFESGTISAEEAEKVIGLCNLPSPPFLIFIVGERMFGSRAAGILLYFNLLTVTVIYGIITRKSCYTPINQAKISNYPPIFTVFTESVSSAANAIVKICAFVAFFSALTGGLTSILGGISPAIKAIIFSSLELTSGIAACSALPIQSLGFIIASASAGWSGLSVFCQIFSLSHTGCESISMRAYLVSKAITAAASSAVTAICVRIFPSLLPSAAPAEDASLVVSEIPQTFILSANIIFIISVFIYLFKKLDRQHII